MEHMEVDAVFAPDDAGANGCFLTDLLGATAVPTQQRPQQGPLRMTKVGPCWFGGTFKQLQVS